MAVYFSSSPSSGFRVVCANAFCPSILPCDPAGPSVQVFEAPIDLMSYCTLHREVCSSAIALCGLHHGALDTYLREYPHLKNIILCLDNDPPGREAAAKFTELYSQKGYHVTIRAPPRGKDWNAFLQERSAQHQKSISK